MLITNGNLDIVDDGIEYVIKTEKKYLDGSVAFSGMMPLVILK